MSPRAVEAFASADLIVAEDTRRARKLLSHCGVKAPVISYHRGNERSRDAKLLEALAGGSTLVLITDAGMPGISDPGEELVRACIDRGVEIDCVPGPSAVLTALVLSGLPPGRFVFEGFLPRTKAARRRAYEALALEARTIVAFEAPHRLRASLADASQILGEERGVAVCRELTKLHQEIWRGALAGAAEHWREVEPRGEFVLVIAGALASDVEDEARDLINEALGAGGSTRDAAAAATPTGMTRKRAYDLALELAKGTKD